MNVGEMRERLEVLAFTPVDGGYEWKVVYKLWAKCEETSGKNLFSTLGTGAKNLIFTVRACNIGLQHALRWKGEHCFVTDIVAVDRMFFKITCASTATIQCAIDRSVVEYNELNNPVFERVEQLCFPACIVEKYAGYTLKKASAESEHRLVMVVPKDITANVGEAVQTLNDIYEIRTCHTLDPYKNEYELTAREDV